MKNLLLVVALGTVGVCLGEVVEVGFRDRGEIKVDAGETLEQTDRVSVDVHGRLYKTGPGELKLRREAIVQPAPFQLTVVDGSVMVTSGDAPAEESQPACLQNAAFWVDASSQNLVTTNGAGLASADCMKAWYDVRETDLDHPTYPYAVPDWWRGDTSYCLNYGVVPPCKTESYGGHAGLYFGGYGDGRATRNGQAALFKNPDGSNCDITNIYHVFAVQAYSNSWGYIFGTWVGSNTSSVKDFHRGGPGYFQQRAGAAVAMTTGNAFLDGSWIDGEAEAVADHPGMHLLECELLNKLAHMQTFFRDSTWAENRAGGDYLYEVAIFTNKLSVAERAAVRRYLMKKWDIPMAGAVRSPAVTLGANGKLRADVGAGAKAPVAAGVSLKGCGAVVKTGDGTAEFPFDLSPEAFEGRVELGAGGLELRRPVSVVAQDGVSYAVASDRRGNAVTAASAEAGSVVKTGRGRLQLAGLPAETAKLDVQGGVVKLVAPRIDCDRTVVTGMVAHIDDPSFESYVSDPEVSRQDNGRKYIGGNNTLWPWTQVVQPGDLYTPNIAMYWMERFSTANGKWPSNGYSAPDGNIAMYLKGDTAAYTTVTIPADGVYEFSFYATARNGAITGANLNHFDLAIGEDLDHLTVFGHLIRTNDPYTRFFYKTPYLKAGRHKLWFRAHVLKADGTTTIDDLRLVRINEPEENVVKVPNGDFEQVSDAYALRLWANNSFAAGWELVNSWTSADYAPATVVTAGSCSGNNPNAMRMFDVGGLRTYGFAALGLFSTGGVARTTSAFVPPAGTYRLRADIGRWNITFQDVAKGGDKTVNLTGNPHVSARVKVGTDVVELGDYPIGHQRNHPCTWTPTFTTDGTKTVVIELWNTVANAGAEVDDVVLVPVKAAGGNLLKNPSFEDGAVGTLCYSLSDWTFAANKVETGVTWSSDVSADTYTRDNVNFARRPLDGSYRLRIRGLGSASQKITLDEGLYRLKFHVLARCTEKGNDISQYGMNPVRAYLTQGTVTNEIGWTYVDFTNYVETAFLFRSPGKGDYTFTLQGMSRPGLQWNPDSTSETDKMTMLDLVSLERVDEAKYAATPEIPETANVKVAEGARLELDFAGTNRITKLWLGGVRVRSGLVSQATHPAYISGPGTLEVTGTGRGAVLIFR